MAASALPGGTWHHGSLADPRLQPGAREDMVTLDYLYCASWSLWLDVKIIARTLPYVLSRRSGEHTGVRL